MPNRIKAIKLTQAEKEARGTHQKCRDVVRPLAEVQEEIAESLQSLEDARYNLREAGKAIRKNGILIDVTTRHNDNSTVITKKLNPACKHAVYHQIPEAGLSSAA